jgi:putative endonuclease
MSAVRQALGRYGEQVAVAHLEGLGMVVLARNWRCRLGEIDIVAVDGACLVVCEVRTRRAGGLAGALESVTPRKVGRLRQLTAAWLAASPDRFAEVRIDVVAVHRPPAGAARVLHLRAVG